MNNHSETNFWCWKSKLQGVLQLLCLLSGYSFSVADTETIMHGLYTGNLEYDLSGPNCFLYVELVLDEDDNDIVFVKAATDTHVQKQVVLINQIQEQLKSIDINLT